MKSLVFATNNRHKLEEVRAILQDKFNIISFDERFDFSLDGRVDGEYDIFTVLSLFDIEFVTCDFSYPGSTKTIDLTITTS